MIKRVWAKAMATAATLAVSLPVWADGTADTNVSGVFDNIGATVLAILKGAGVIAGGAFCIINIIVGVNTKQPSKIVGGVIGLIILGALVTIIKALQTSAAQ